MIGYVQTESEVLFYEQHCDPFVCCRPQRIQKTSDHSRRKTLG